jgi:16S rRNA (guanine527-N7)-methyltransferase
LTLLPLLAELPDGGRVGDVGSGGGVPALPLAIVLPRLRFECVESTGKKAAFIAAAATALGLPNVDVLNERAEDAGAFERRSRAESRRDAYDAVTARAVGRIAVLAELTVPLAKVGGRVLMIKGAKADEELAEAKQALHMLHAAHAGTIETPTGRIVVIEKLRQSPRVYPRKPGTPKSQPLGVSGS